MKERFFIIALIISECAFLYGLFYTDVDKVIYEWQNGPPLVDENFCRRVKTACDNSSNYIMDYHIGADCNPPSFFWLKHREGKGRPLIDSL